MVCSTGGICRRNGASPNANRTRLSFVAFNVSISQICSEGYRAPQLEDWKQHQAAMKGVKTFCKACPRGRRSFARKKLFLFLADRHDSVARFAYLHRMPSRESRASGRIERLPAVRSRNILKEGRLSLRFMQFWHLFSDGVALP